jgi:SAM-dependent methyltransferase
MGHIVARLRQPIPILLNRIVDRCWEWRLGVQTSGIQTPDQCVRDDANPYIPIPFRTFFRTMKHVPDALLTGTFLDYGAGKGRALVLAARYYNFRQVVGVEISPELCRQAACNLKQTTGGRAEIICCDAATYQPPPDTKVFFFYNPFFGETMKMVLHNLRNSLLENPRRAAIIVCRARNFLADSAGQDWFVERASGRMLSSLNWYVFVTRSPIDEETDSLAKRCA